MHSASAKQKNKTANMPRRSLHLGTVRAARRAQRDHPYSGRERSEKTEQGNRWSVTLNFGGETDFNDMSEAKTASLRRLNAGAQVPPCTYAIFQPERGANGTLHVQGYFEFNKRMTLAQVKAHLGERIHAEVAKGTQEENIKYCSKEGDDGRIAGAEVVTFGEPMAATAAGTRGSRTDWASAWRLVKAGASDIEVIEQHPNLIPNFRALTHARFALQCERSRKETTKLVVFWGDPDTGKTTTAISLCVPGSYFVLTADGKQVWWDGYDPDKHTTVIIDEFVGSKMPLTFLNMLADVIDCNVQTKGGFKRFLAETIIITSNFSPREWYRACVEARVESLYRRINIEVEFRLVDTAANISRPHETHKALHLEVHKGKFSWPLVESRYPFDQCCAAVCEAERNQSSEELHPSTDEVVSNMRQRFENQQGDSSDHPIELGSESISEDFESDEDQALFRSQCIPVEEIDESE